MKEKKDMRIVFMGTPEFGVRVLEKLNELADENKELKSFKDNVFNLLDKKLEEYPYLTLSEKWDNNCKYKHSCRENHEKNVAYASTHTLLNELLKELEE